MQPQANVFLNSTSSESKFCHHTWISHEILLSLCAGLLLNWNISRFEQVMQFSVIVGNKTWGVISSVMEIHVSLLYSLIIISSTSKNTNMYSYCCCTPVQLHWMRPDSLCHSSTRSSVRCHVPTASDILLVQLYNLAFINPIYCMSDV